MTDGGYDEANEKESDTSVDSDCGRFVVCNTDSVCWRKKSFLWSDIGRLDAGSYAEYGKSAFCQGSL